MFRDYDDALVLATVYGHAYQASRERGFAEDTARGEAARAARDFVQVMHDIDEEIRTAGSGGKG